MDVLTIGETMILFTPTDSLKYSQYFTKSIGGAETNVAIGLSRLGHNVGWISKVGNDQFGKSITSFVKGEGVNVDNLTVDATANTGIYFKEIINASNVNIQYYRKNSAASKLAPNDLDKSYLANTKYLFFTGITPALSDSCHQTILKAIEIAKKNNIKVVFDPNLRRKLWSEEKAKEVLTNIALQSDIFLPGIDEAQFLIEKKQPEKVLQEFKRLGIPLTILKDGANGSYYLDDEEFIHVPAERVDRVVDPVGAGDAFAAGLLSGLLDKLSIHDAVKRGNILGALVVQTMGDIEGLPDREELSNYKSMDIDVHR